MVSPTPIRVMNHIKVQIGVLVGIEKNGRCTPQRILDGLNLFKCPISLIAEPLKPIKTGDHQIAHTIAVVIGSHDCRMVSRREIQKGRLPARIKLPSIDLAVQPPGVTKHPLRRRIGRPPTGSDNIELAIAIVVDQRRATPCRLDQREHILLASIAILTAEQRSWNFLEPQPTNLTRSGLRLRFGHDRLGPHGSLTSPRALFATEDQPNARYPQHQQPQVHQIRSGHSGHSGP